MLDLTYELPADTHRTAVERRLEMRTTLRIQSDLRLDYANGRDPGSVAHSHVGRDNTLYRRRAQRSQMQSIERPEHDGRRCPQGLVKQSSRF